MNPIKLLLVIICFSFWFSFFALGGVCIGSYLINPERNITPLLVLDIILFVASVFTTAITADEFKEGRK